MPEYYPSRECCAQIFARARQKDMFGLVPVPEVTLSEWGLSCGVLKLRSTSWFSSAIRILFLWEHPQNFKVALNYGGNPINRLILLVFFCLNCATIGQFGIML